MGNDRDLPSIRALDDECAATDRLAALQHIGHRRGHERLGILGRQLAKKLRVRFADDWRPAPQLCRPPVMPHKATIRVECASGGWKQVEELVGTKRAARRLR